jgi:hypothetical protein
VKGVHQIIATLAIAGAMACDRERVSSDDGPPHIGFDIARGVDSAVVIVTGLTRAELRGARGNGFADSSWANVFAVSVSGNEEGPVAGRYTVTDTAIVFQPLFAFDRGRSYTVRFDRSRLGVARSDTIVLARLALPTIDRQASTSVVRVTPTAVVVPENLLRLYIEFSAPMSRRGGLDFITLLDSAGREVRGAFLPLEADFWNADRTRYTVFFDPGRVKQGILPNEAMGRPLRAGGTYTLVVDPRWQDGNGLPLARGHRHTFRVGPPDQAPISVSTWQLSAPQSGRRDPLVVLFAEPLDHGLLKRALGVEQADGTPIVGEATIGRVESEWRFTPQSVWREGPHRLVVLSILEDLAGNRIGQPFEVDTFERVDSTAAPERVLVPFLIR